MEAALYIEYDRGPNWGKAWDHIENLAAADVRPLIEAIRESGEEFLRDNPEWRDEMESDEPVSADDETDGAISELWEMLNELQAWMDARWQARDYLRLERFAVFVYDHSEASIVEYLARVGALDAAGLRLAEQP